MKERIAKYREFFFEQHFRYTLGQSFLVIINFALLVYSVSDKLSVLLGFPAKTLVLVLIPTAFFCVWLLGYFMDKVVKAPQMTERQSYKRSEIWDKHLAQADETITRLDAMEKAIRELTKKREDR